MSDIPDKSDTTMMKANCPKCNAVVDAYDNACPECRYKFGDHEKYTLLKKTLFWIVVLGLIGGAIYLYAPSLLPI